MDFQEQLDKDESYICLFEEISDKQCNIERCMRIMDYMDFTEPPGEVEGVSQLVEFVNANQDIILDELLKRYALNGNVLTDISKRTSLICHLMFWAIGFDKYDSVEVIGKYMVDINELGTDYDGPGVTVLDEHKKHSVLWYAKILPASPEIIELLELHGASTF